MFLTPPLLGIKMFLDVSGSVRLESTTILRNGGNADQRQGITSHKTLVFDYCGSIDGKSVYPSAEVVALEGVEHSL
jgi:hypothetical protein